MVAWQAAQAGSVRWASSCSRSEVDSPSSGSATSVSTLSGGSAGGWHSICWSSHLPRRVGEVLDGCYVSARKAPLWSSPPRGWAVVSTSTKVSPVPGRGSS